MKKNKYTSEFDEKIYSIISQYQKGEISEKILKIALTILFNQYYPERFSRMVSNFEEKPEQKILGINLRSVRKFYNGAI